MFGLEANRVKVSTGFQAKTREEMGSVLGVGVGLDQG